MYNEEIGAMYEKKMYVVRVNGRKNENCLAVPSLFELHQESK